MDALEKVIYSINFDKNKLKTSDRFVYDMLVGGYESRENTLHLAMRFVIGKNAISRIVNAYLEKSVNKSSLSWNDYLVENFETLPPKEVVDQLLDVKKLEYMNHLYSKLNNMFDNKLISERNHEAWHNVLQKYTEK